MDIQEIERILRLARELGLHEVLIEDKGFKLRVRVTSEAPTIPAPPATSAAAGPAPAPAAAPAPQAPTEAQPATETGSALENPEEAEKAGLYVLKAPMVGTFYRRPAPDKPPFVEEGDIVKPGQVVCLIEAMKIFNEIETEQGGKVLKILVEDATPVEFGQPLMIIDPRAK